MLGSRHRWMRTAASSVAILTLAISGTASAAPAPPASAWVAGHHPSCDSFTVDISGDPALITYNDRTLPKIVSLKSRTIVVGNQPTRIRLVATHATDTCSGIAGAKVSFRLDQRHGPTQYGTLPLGISAGTPWDAWLSLGVTASAGSVGRITVRGIEVLDRYSTVTLDPLDRYVSSTPSTLHPSTLRAAAYNGVTYQALRRTSLAMSLSGTSVRAGASNWVRGKLVVANGTTYVPLAGQRVWLQRRYSATSPWLNVRSAVTSRAGAVRILHRPIATVSYRLVYAGWRADYDAPVNSAAASMRVR